MNKSEDATSPNNMNACPPQHLLPTTRNKHVAAAKTYVSTKLLRRAWGALDSATQFLLHLSAVAGTAARYPHVDDLARLVQDGLVTLLSSAASASARFLATPSPQTMLDNNVSFDKSWYEYRVYNQHYETAEEPQTLVRSSPNGIKRPGTVDADEG